MYRLASSITTSRCSYPALLWPWCGAFERGRSTRQPPPSGIRPELLVVLVEQGARVAGDVADRRRGHPVGVAQAAEAAPARGPGARSRAAARAAGPGGRGRTATPPGPRGSRPRPRRAVRRGERCGRELRSRRPGLALGPVPAHPLVRGRPADARAARRRAPPASPGLSTRLTRSCRLKTLSLGLGCPTREPSPWLELRHPNRSTRALVLSTTCVGTTPRACRRWRGASGRSPRP